MFAILGRAREDREEGGEGQTDMLSEPHILERVNWAALKGEIIGFERVVCF
jgi:hypothetical protein